jgi:hypothetical protein
MTKALPRKLSIVIILSLIALAFFVTTSFAEKSAFVPGWGFGDVASIHTGPPGGPSVHPIFQENNTSISNSVSVSTNTGGNSGNATSGNVSTNINISNTGGQNIVN